MTRKTTKTKKELAASLAGTERQERQSLAENRNVLFDKFYNNLRLLCAAETISMVDLARKLNMKSGRRIYDLSYGKGIPSTEELIALSSHFQCSIDMLLNGTAIIGWKGKTCEG